MVAKWSQVITRSGVDLVPPAQFVARTVRRMAPRLGIDWFATLSPWTMKGITFASNTIPLLPFPSPFPHPLSNFASPWDRPGAHSSPSWPTTSARRSLAQAPPPATAHHGPCRATVLPRRVEPSPQNATMFAVLLAMPAPAPAVESTSPASQKAAEGSAGPRGNASAAMGNERGARMCGGWSVQGTVEVVLRDESSFQPKAVDTKGARREGGTATGARSARERVGGVGGRKASTMSGEGRARSWSNARNIEERGRERRDGEDEGGVEGDAGEGEGM